MYPYHQTETLRRSQNQDSDIAAALDALAKDSAYLFEPAPKDAPAAEGGIRLNSAAPHGGQGAPDYDNMSDAEYYAAVLKTNK